MRGPSSPRGWLNFAVDVRARNERPYSPRFEYTGFGDRRTSDIRETGISVIMLAERASHSVSGNGVGYRLLLDFYVLEVSWYAFSDNERFILNKTIRRFRRELQAAGFLPKENENKESKNA